MRPPFGPSHRLGRQVDLIAKAPPIGLLADPLAYILADHGRQRVACAMLNEFATESRASRASADIVSAFLAHDLPLHFADEEENLFPAMRLRALPEDAIGPLLVRLVADHCRCRQQLDHIVAALTPVSSADPVELEVGIGEIMQAYSMVEQQHLAIENAIVMPLAKKRLTSGDLKTMSQHMHARRGVPH